MKTVVTKKRNQYASAKPRQSRSRGRSRAWHSRLFRALFLSRNPLLLIGVFLAVGVVAFFLYSYAAGTSKYLAPETYQTCGHQPCWCPGQEINDITQKGGMEYSMRCLINYARKVQGVQELSEGGDLDASSTDKNRDIVSCDQFSHTACGRSKTYWFFKDGFLPGTSYWLVGENLGWGSLGGGSPRSVMSAWLNSTEHRSNIFDSKFSIQGLSVRFSNSLFSNTNVYTWVSHFGCHDSTACR